MSKAVKPIRCQRTNRGFALKKYRDTRGCTIRIQRSSSACEEAVWIFCNDTLNVYQQGAEKECSPHLNRAQARHVAKALLAFADGRMP